MLIMSSDGTPPAWRRGILRCYRAQVQQRVIAIETIAYASRAEPVTDLGTQAVLTQLTFPR
jgi:hypothetical protein